MARFKLFWFIFVAYSSLCEAFKILAVFPFPGKSHTLLGFGLTKLLLEAGHEVTFVTPFPNNHKHPNFHEIDVSAILDDFPSEMIDIKKILNKENEIDDIKDGFRMLMNLSDNTYKNENLQKMLNDTKLKFDVVIAEWMFSEIAAGFSAVYDAPYIWFYSCEPNSWVLSLVDEALNPAYNSDMMSNNVPPLTFIQRSQELWNQATFTAFMQLFVSRSESKIYEDVFGPILAKRGKLLPPLSEIKYNASIMLLNSYVSFGHSMTLPQSAKPIAGYHIDPDIKPLPEDLKKIMDNATNGVIYFSMGSNLKGKDWPVEIKNGLLKIFGELKQTVLWKFEDESTDLPDNVHLLSWAPQHSILAHKNCILFITHGGFLSITESMHFGVPVIGIPVFADQFKNVKRAAIMGFGKEVPLSYSIVDDLKAVIEDVINNPKYRERVKELSLVYHDRVAPPAAELVHWVEHVVRTRGAPHLRSPALLVPWYQKFYIDLLAVIVAVIFIVKIAINRMFCSKKKQKKDKKNN